MPRLAPALVLSLAVVTTARATGCPGAALERYEPRSFLGYACADDCQRQKAGFAWAERHTVADPAACGHLAAAVADGCRAYVEESLTPEQAGYRWALENETTDLCLCDGAGEGFRVGCLAALAEAGGAPAPAALKRGPGAPGRFIPGIPAGKLPP